MEGDILKWNKIGTSSECTQLTKIRIYMVQIPTGGGGTISSQCQGIKIYDTNWQQLTSEQLQNYKTGQKVRFAVNTTTAIGSIDHVKFIINGVERPPTSLKNDSNEFYDEYTLPEAVKEFDVNVKMHHSEFGWL
jgi:hypothetical protein